MGGKGLIERVFDVEGHFIPSGVGAVPRFEATLARDRSRGAPGVGSRGPDQAAGSAHAKAGGSDAALAHPTADLPK